MKTWNILQKIWIKVVSKSQIRNIIKAYKEALPIIFPDRYDDEGVLKCLKPLFLQN